jgi:hypothetical protein
MVRCRLEWPGGLEAFEAGARPIRAAPRGVEELRRTNVKAARVHLAPPGKVDPTRRGPCRSCGNQCRQTQSRSDVGSWTSRNPLTPVGQAGAAALRNREVVDHDHHDRSRTDRHPLS